MKTSQRIDLFSGFESQVFPTLAQPAGVTTLTIPITGWEWWALASARFTVNNGGGAATAQPFVSLQYGNLIAFTAGTSLLVGVGAVQINSFGLFAPQSTGAATAVMAGLPFIPVIDEGGVIIGYQGGDAATVLLTGFVVIIGRRRRNTPQ